MPRSHSGDRGQADSAPNRLPITNERIVVTISRPMVQGSASMIRIHTVLGNLLSETPRSKRAMPHM